MHYNTPECQNLRLSIKSMLGILVRRTCIPLRYVRLELRVSLLELTDIKLVLG